MEVVNIRRHKPTNKDVYIGRAGKGQTGTFGNPFPLNPNEPRGATLERYKKYLRENKELQAKIKALPRDTILVCFCKPSPCHGDIIKHFFCTGEI